MVGIGWLVCVRFCRLFVRLFGYVCFGYVRLLCVWLGYVTLDSDCLRKEQLK